MKTFPIGFQRHQLYPHNGRRTEGERKRNWDSSRTLVSGSSWTRLRLVAAHSSLALLRWKNVSHAAPCSYLNLTAHASQRSLLQVSLWYALIQTATSPSILVNLGVYLHNGRASEGERKRNKCLSRRSSRKCILHYHFDPHNGRGTEGIQNWKRTRGIVFL